MKLWLIFFIMVALVTSGCIGNLIAEKVPVLYVNVTVNEDANGTMIIKGVEAYGGEMPEFDAPGEQLPKNFPAIFTEVVQNMTIITYKSGNDYTVPGVYNYSIGFWPGELNRSAPMVIWVKAVNENSDYVDAKSMDFKWSSEVQSKTFK